VQNGYKLSHAKYAYDLVSQAGLIVTKMTNSPIQTNVKLLTTDGEPIPDATL
jgi:hypothetical protein